MSSHVSQVEPIEGFVPPLTDAQAKMLAHMFARSVRWEYYPALDHIKDALVRKGLVEQGVDGKYGIAPLGLSALAIHFAHEARKRGGSTVGLIAERAAA
ncbi:MAG: hypothetical protein JWO51_177 [Rhodospirillales bacterium]|nr:hypothetical protein [Rhodospirillales bacterium]